MLQKVYRSLTNPSHILDIIVCQSRSQDKMKKEDLQSLGCNPEQPAVHQQEKAPSDITPLKSSRKRSFQERKLTAPESIFEGKEVCSHHPNTSMNKREVKYMEMQEGINPNFKRSLLAAFQNEEPEFELKKNPPLDKVGVLRHRVNSDEEKREQFCEKDSLDIGSYLKAVKFPTILSFDEDSEVSNELTVPSVSNPKKKLISLFMSGDVEDSSEEEGSLECGFTLAPLNSVCQKSSSDQKRAVLRLTKV